MKYRVLFLFLVSASPALAGSYFGSRTSDACGGGECKPFIVVHPAGYTSAGNGGPIDVPICIAPGAAEVVQRAVEHALETWNGHLRRWLRNRRHFQVVIFFESARTQLMTLVVAPLVYIMVAKGRVEKGIVEKDETAAAERERF